MFFSRIIWMRIIFSFLSDCEIGHFDIFNQSASGSGIQIRKVIFFFFPQFLGSGWSMHSLSLGCLSSFFFNRVLHYYCFICLIILLLILLIIIWLLINILHYAIIIFKSYITVITSLKCVTLWIGLLVIIALKSSHGIRTDVFGRNIIRSRPT